MKPTLTERLIAKLSHWLLKNSSLSRAYLCDFERICEQIFPADVLLIEGRSKSSKIIRQVTQSPWTHAALYIGRLENIKDKKKRQLIKSYGDFNEHSHLLVESEIGLGTVVSNIDKYQDEHIRILRPQGLAGEDANKIISFALSRLGRKYSLRHLFDLARLLFPWGMYPRRWRSSLFEHNALQPTKDICSSMIADAFQSVHFPILPLIQKNDKQEIELIRRNPKLFTPCDFDYSPYFAVIKYPFFILNGHTDYKSLPWRANSISDDSEPNKQVTAQDKKK